MILLVLILVLISIVGVYLYRRKDKMPIYKGNKEISELYHGSTKISELYHGSKLVYESYKEPWYKSDESGYRYGVMNKSTTVVDKGVYNRGILLSHGGSYSIIDGKVYSNYMDSEVTALSGSNYYDNTSGQNVFFKNGGLYSSSGTQRATGGWTKSFGRPASNSTYAVKNKEIYIIKFKSGGTATPDTTTKVMNFNTGVIISKYQKSNYVIIDSNLYTGAYSSSLTLSNSGGWTALGGVKYGIKNGNIYNTFNMTLIDDTKTWVDISTSFSSNDTIYFIANDGSLGKLDNSGNFSLEPFKTSHKLKGRWEKFANTYVSSFTGGGYDALVIRNGALYKLTYNDITLIDDTRYYTECSGDCSTSAFGVAVSSGNRVIDNS